MNQSNLRKKPDSGWTLGVEVRRRRMDLGLTIEELAERSGLSANFVGTIETGKRDPSISTLMALARGLDIPARDLLPGFRDLSPSAMEAAEAFESAPPEIKEGVISVLRFHRDRRTSSRG